MTWYVLFSLGSSPKTEPVVARESAYRYRLSKLNRRAGAWRALKTKQDRGIPLDVVGGGLWVMG
jgi:hypothetical protein